MDTCDSWERLWGGLERGWGYLNAEGALRAEEGASGIEDIDRRAGMPLKRREQFLWRRGAGVSADRKVN